MLKNKIFALILAMAVVFDSAMLAVYAETTENLQIVTNTLLNENFDLMTYSASGYKNHNTEVELTGTDLGIRQKWNTANIKKETENDNNYLYEQVDINSLSLFFNTDETVQIKTGDKIELNFDFRQKDAEAKFYMKLKGNNSSTYTHVSGNSWSNGTNSDGIIVSKLKTRIYPGYLNYGVSGEDWYVLGKWYTINVVIDTEAEDCDNEQTIHLTIIDKETQSRVKHYYGKLDTDGDSSNGITKLSTFSGFEFVTEPRKYDESDLANCVPTKLDLDNIIIDHTTTEEINYPISYVKQNIINENFETASLVTPNTSGHEKKIDGTENIITYTTSGWSGISNIRADISEDDEKGKVLSNTFGTAGYNTSVIKLKDEVITPISSGDELHINFDLLYTDKSGKIALKLNDTEKLAFTAKEYPGKSQGTWMKNIAGTGSLLEISKNRVMPCGTDYFQNGWSNGYAVTEPNKWYNFKIIIKTKDKSYNNDQTINIIMDDGENKTVFCGVLDKIFNGTADSNNSISVKDSVIDKILDFSELKIDVSQTAEENGGVPVEYMLDNLMIDIVKPGFWIYGEAVSEFGVRPNGFETQRRVIIECAADVDYIANTSRTANLITAQYENDRLIYAETKPVTITNDDYAFTYSTIVDESADTVKAFLFGENIEPIVGCLDVTNLENDSETGNVALNSTSYDFETLESNVEPEDISYINFNPDINVFQYKTVDGVFGKNTNDTALSISNNSNPFTIGGFTGENANIRYQAAAFETGRFDVQDNESIVLEFEVANESNNTVKTIKSAGYIDGASTGAMDNVLEIGKDGSAWILGHRVKINGSNVNVQNGKWYNVRLVLKPADDFTGTVNKVTAYWDGMVAIEDLPFNLGSGNENRFEGFSNLEIGYDIKNSALANSTLLGDGSAAQYNADAVYIDNLACEVLNDADIEKTDLILMSGSAYYANTIDMPKGIIYDYGQSPALYTAKLKADDLKTAVFVDESGYEVDEVISGGYLKLKDNFDRDIYYKVEDGTDEVMQSISDIDAVNEGNPDLSGYFVYEQPDITKLKGSALDASFVLDAPAGKYGFVHRDGDAFVFDNGEEIQFWGINIGGQGAFPESKEEAEAIADRVATAGFNLVRIHNIDGGTRPNVFGYNKSGKVLDEAQMDKLCYLLAELKERGIYFYIDQTSYRPVFEDDNLDSTDGIWNGLKGPTYFNRKVIDIQKDYSEMLLGYENPYTGLTLAEDPAMAMIGLNNEFTLIDDIGSLGDYYYKELGELFSEWLIEKYGSRSKVLTAWWQWGKDGILSSEDPTKGTVMLRCYDSTSYSKARSNDEMEFIGKIMSDYFEERISHLREIGVKCAITGNTAYSGSEVPCFYSNTYTDFIDYHNYWSHPQGGEKMLNTEGTYFNEYNKNQSVLENTASDKMGLMGFIGRVASKKIYGYPLVISEWMFCPGNPYMSEGMLMTAAYGRLQGWHPILFALNANNDYFSRVEDGYEFVQENPFSTSDNPIYAAAYPATSIMYLRKDVAEAQSGYYNTYSDDNIYLGTNHDTVWWGSYQLKSMNEYGLVGKTGSVFTGRSDTPSNDENLKTAVENSSSTKVYKSNTNELTTDLNKQVFTVNSEYSKGVSGFIGNEEIDLDGVKVDVDNNFATVMLTSLDDSPIDSSKRILLTMVGNSRNYGQIFSEDTNTVIKGGKYPIITEQIIGKFVFDIDGAYKAYTLNSSGERMYEIPLTITESGFEFNVNEDFETMNIEIVSEN